MCVCSGGFPGRWLLIVAVVRKTLKGQSGKGQRIYSTFNNVLMSIKSIWYVASVNFQQLSLGRNKFSDLHLRKYNPELSCSAGHKIKQILQWKQAVVKSTRHRGEAGWPAGGTHHPFRVNVVLLV